VCINSENGIMDEAHEKLKQILDLASAEDNEKLRSELAKMIPTGENSKVTTKIGWGHYDHSVHASISFFVTGYKVTNEEVDLIDIYKMLINKLEDEDKIRLVESFDVILSNKPNKIKLGNLPSMEILDQTRAISTSFEIFMMG